MSDTKTEREMFADLRSRVETLEKLDREAATHVETVIVMRTAFDGDPPYVGWKGLGLALTEALDKRDALEQENKRLREALEEGKQ